MGSTRTRMLLLSAVLSAAVLRTASAQESNFGVKVKCFLKDGTVVCPGCNSRAGLLCPRNTNIESCNVNPEIPPNAKPPPVTQIYEDEPKPTTIKDTQNLDAKNTTREVTHSFGDDDISQEEIEYWSKKARENLQFRLFLYRILQPPGRRWKRDAQLLEEDEDDEATANEEKYGDDEATANKDKYGDDEAMANKEKYEEGTCSWNGDCPCPLICCKTGDGCPKRCVKGIRLPPPWG